MLFVFISQPDFGCNPYALWKYINDNTKHETAWIVREKYVYENLCERGINCAMYDTMLGNKLLKRASFVVTNATAHYIFLPKYENARFVCLWHGSGIKAHDYSNPNLPQQQIAILDDFNHKTDLLCVHSLDDRYRLSSLLHFDMRKCVVTGQPRLDNVIKSNGRQMLNNLFSADFSRYEKLFFFAPSVRANTFMSAGKIFSDNIFRLSDYSDDEMSEFLVSNNAAMVYKFHPAEQKSFATLDFQINEHCYALTDRALFDANIRYTDILNAFDALITDYSTIAFDFLLLDRPIIYLVPDFSKYYAEQGFAFNNVEDYMPGSKAEDFSSLLSALQDSITEPCKYAKERAFVIKQRFDYADEHSAERVYNAIINYMPLPAFTKMDAEPILPSNAEHLGKFFADALIIDSTKPFDDIELQRRICEKANKVIYITEETPDEFHPVKGKSSTDVADLEMYSYICSLPHAQICLTTGGVDYTLFASQIKSEKNDKITLGYAGIIDCRIYIAMVQYISNAFPDCDILFAGDIIGGVPSWLRLHPNIRYIGPLKYQEMPEFISSLDVCLLPFYEDYNERVPSELFQYLACGKMVVASNMPNLPECDAIFKSASIADMISNVKTAIQQKDELIRIGAAKQVAKEYDWSRVALRAIRPLISIILPTYNGASYIRQSIESCLSQTYDNIELIIVDDCSTDNTPEIIREYAQRDKRVRMITNEKNMELPTSLNIGHRYAKGEYLTWTSDDNYYLQNAIEELVTRILLLKADIVYANTLIIDEKGDLNANRFFGGQYRTGPADDLPLKNPIGSCFLYKRTVFEYIEGYDEEKFCSEDWDYWLRCFNAGFAFEHLDKILYAYRYHSKNLTAINARRIYNQAVDLRLNNLEQHADSISDVMRMRIYLLMAGDAKKLNDKSASIKWFNKAIEVSADATKFSRKDLIDYVTGE